MATFIEEAMTEILDYCPFCKKHFNEGEEVLEA